MVELQRLPKTPLTVFRPLKPFMSIAVTAQMQRFLDLLISLVSASEYVWWEEVTCVQFHHHFT